MQEYRLNTFDNIEEDAEPKKGNVTGRLEKIAQ
jgi:hypothetical protein